jgi:citrate lyase subunit beta/citryl-CoA lyase
MTRTDLLWRSLLYVPTNIPRFVEKAHLRGADGIILDLEDSIPPGEKSTARDMLQDAAAQVGQNGADVLVRINQPLELAVRDIEAAINPRVRALQLPKVEGPDHVRLLATLVDRLEVERGMEPGHTLLAIMIESAKAFLKINEIAAAHPRIVAIMIGGEDLSLDLGMEPAPDTLQYPKQQSVIAARAAGIIPLGLLGTVADYQDLDSIRENALRSARFGLEGASCIHPAVVPLLNEAFSPSPGAVVRAQRIVEAYDQSIAEGRGSIEVGGHMVDVPVVLRAQRLLAREAVIKSKISS